MKASTIKVEDPLLTELYRYKPKDLSFSAYVRDLLEQAIRRRRSIESANQYVEFLQSHPEESEWLADWETADLALPPKQKKIRKKKK